MNKLIFLVVIQLLVIVFISCKFKSSKTETDKIDAAVYERIMESGNEISTLAQGVLLANVGQAIQQGGTEFAVQFCNLKASSIIDSLNSVNDCVISRVSPKNRNPENLLQNETEENLWEYYSMKDRTANLKDTLIRDADLLVYYKPIKMVIPTCLNCHGVAGEDIEQTTYNTIQDLYPTDRAIGYKLNDLRGLWKIEFKTNNE